MSNHTKGILCGLGASILWGTTFVVGRYLVDGCHVEPLFLAALRFTLGTVVAALFLLITGQGGMLWAARVEWPRLVPLGFMGMGLMGICVFLSNRYTQAVNTSMIVNANTIFLALIGLLIGERLAASGYLGILIGLVGCIVVVWGQPSHLPGTTNHVLGALLALVASLSWALYTIAGKGICRRLGGPVASTWTMLGGAVFCVVVAALWGSPRPLSPTEIWAVLFLAIFPTAIAMLLWFKGLEYIDAAVIGPTQYLAPVSSIVFAYLLLGESLTPLFGVGAALVVGGMWLSNSGTPSHQDDQA